MPVNPASRTHATQAQRGFVHQCDADRPREGVPKTQASKRGDTGRIEVSSAETRRFVQRSYHSGVQVNLKPQVQPLPITTALENGSSNDAPLQHTSPRTCAERNMRSQAPFLSLSHQTVKGEVFVSRDRHEIPPPESRYRARCVGLW